MSAFEVDEDCGERANAAVYALGALEDADVYREHLLSCTGCRAEVAELQLAVDSLPGTVTPARVPESLRRKVLDAVRSEADVLHAAGRKADRAPRARRTPARWRLLVAGSATLAAGAAALIVLAVSSGSSNAVRVTTAQIATSERGAHGALRVTSGRAELVLGGMRQAPRGQIYEVWLSRGKGSAPAATDALFGVTRAGRASVVVPGPLRGIREVLVTHEPLGGSLHPTSAPIVRVVL
jgi:Anti-sigma-K factor rskA